jgi:hypothetical protein
VYPKTGLSDGPTVGDFALSLAVDADVVSPPEVLNLTLSLANDASIDFTATLGAAILFPTGELMFFPDWGFSLTGLEIDFPAGFEVEDYPLLTTQVPDSAPIGQYMAYAAIFGPGDFDCVLSDMAQVAWRIEARK